MSANKLRLTVKANEMPGKVNALLEHSEATPDVLALLMSIIEKLAKSFNVPPADIDEAKERYGALIVGQPVEFIIVVPLRLNVERAKRRILQAVGHKYFDLG